jgi:hypothetical protein
MAVGLPAVSQDGRESAGLCPADSATNGACGGTATETSEASFAIDIRNVRLLQVLRRSVRRDGIIGVGVWGCREGRFLPLVRRVSARTVTG